MRRMLPTAAATAVCIASMTAIAGLPAAADRVPAEALVTIAIDDVAEFHDAVTSFLGKLPIPVDDEPLEAIEMLIDADGVNEDGSLAFVIMPETDEPVAIAPVDDYNAFVTGFGGNAGGGVDEFEIEGQSFFAKNLGGGYAVVAPRASLIENFDGNAGNMAAHTKSVGKTGAKLAESSNLIVMANIPALAPTLKEGLAEQMEQMAGIAQMMGGAQADQIEGQMKMMNLVAESFLRDADAGLLGIGFADHGVTLDLAAHFKEGSEIAGFFQQSGDSSSMLSRVPNMDYIFAGAVDASPNGLQTIAKNFAALSDEFNLSQPGFDIGQWLNAGNGFAGIMGKTPAPLMGGLFSNTVYFLSGDGADIAGALKNTYAGMDGTSQQGMTFNTSFDAGDVEVEGRTVDAWSLGFELDPNNPNAFQMQQGMMMFLGPEMKMAGYGAATDKGYIQTMSQSKTLMAQALESAKDGNGLAKADTVRAMAARLPEDRTAEVYVGIDTMLGYAQQIMAMMGGPAQIDVPDNLNPIATGMTTSEGGFRSTTVIPMDVIDTLAKLAAQMGAGGGGDAQPRGNPRF
ncbi:MAG: hypothetical protein AAGK04_07715 [Planctomycetota bacterium]